jgi:ParB-like chromosome segregation protein Spo0J
MEAITANEITGKISLPEDAAALKQQKIFERRRVQRTGKGRNVPEAPIDLGPDPVPVAAPVDTDPATAIPRLAALLEEMGRVTVLATVDLHPDSILVDEGTNTRRGTGDVADLEASMLAVGQEQPIRVTKLEGDPSGKTYRLVFGYRRVKAAKAINQKLAYDPIMWPDGFLLRAEVVSYSHPSGAFISNVVENTSRRDLTMVEQAEIMDALAQEGMNRTQISTFLGVSKATVTQYLRILGSCPKRILKLIHDGKVSYSKCLEILDRHQGDDEALKNAWSAMVGEGSAATAAGVAAAAEDAAARDPKTDGVKEKKKTPTVKQFKFFLSETLDADADTDSDPGVWPYVAGWLMKYLEGKMSSRTLKGKFDGLRMAPVKK